MQYHHEGQIGTLRGMMDENGNRIAKIDTGKYGKVYRKDILFDGRPSRVGEAYSPDEGLSRIDLAGGHTYRETVKGAVLRAADANGAYTAIVTDLDSTNFEWIELDDASGDVLDAISAGATQEEPCFPESRCILGGGRYPPPIAGFTTDLGVEGSQPGSNMSGQHYMWNRVYDINTGRWTTPDRYALPWANLFDYSHQSPTSHVDPAGTLLPVLAAIGGAAILVGGALLAGGCSVCSAPPAFSYTWALDTTTTPDLPTSGTMAGVHGRFHWTLSTISGVAGVTASFRFTPFDSCGCDNISFIQVVRSQIDARPAYPDSTHHPRFQSTTGWRVDHVKGQKDPYYGMMLHGSVGWVSDSGDRGRGYCGTPGGHARMADRPSFTSFPQYHFAQEFETCAVCVSGNPTNPQSDSDVEVLGCLKWASFTRGGWTSARVLGGRNTNFSHIATSTFKGAVRKWNSLMAEKVNPPRTLLAMGRTSAV